MNKIFFLILVCKNVIANDEESNEKYIDLLPEEEKQEFLNRIARRILEGIKSDDTPNESHADITDDQLDAHGAFVQEILEEESDNLKKEKRRSESKEGDTNDRIEINNDIKNEHSDGGIESNTGNKEENIDLTLREGKRQKRTNGNNEFDKETTPDITYDAIPVKTVYDQFENDVVRVDSEALVTPLKEDSKLEAAQEGNLTRKGEEIISTLSKEREENDNNEESVALISDLGNSSNLIIADTDLESDKIERSINLRKYFHNKLKLGTTAVMIDFEPNSNENSTAADYNINDGDTTLLPTTVSEEVMVRTANDEDNWVSTQKIYDNFSEEKEEDKKEETATVFNTTNNDVTVTNKESITTSSSAVTIMSNNESSNTTISNVTYSDLYKAKGNFSRSFVNSIDQQVKNVKTETEISTAKTDTIEKTSRSELVSEIISDIQFDSSSVTPNLSTLGVTEIENMATPKDIAHLKSVEHNTPKANSLEKLDNSKTMLRARLDNSEMSQIEENESKENYDEDSKKASTYDVFEVDPNQPHFMTTNKPLQNGHPLYVPVYNYAPENAFFRPYNKFGPNTEDFNNKDTPESIKDEDSIPINLVSARNLFSGYSIDKKRTSYDKNIKQTSKKLKPKHNIFMKTVTHNWLKKKLYYNPNDYADLDYYFGRVLRRGKKYRSQNLNNIEKTKKYIPDSNEDGHPISTIHKSDTIKDHVRAVRNILYLQKKFGYVPKGNERLIRKANQFIRNGTKPKTLKIFMGNYFDRANPVKDAKNELFRLNKSKVKHKINTNIKALTPNPLNLELNLKNTLEVQNLGTQNHSKSTKQEVDEIPFKIFFDAMIIVLDDSIKVNNEKLVKYDWLKTTVNIQAALRKLLDLIKQLKYGGHVHPKDVELVKYTIYLFKSSQTALGEEMRSKNFNKIKNIIKEKQRKEGKRKSLSKLPKSKAKIKAKDPIKLWKNYATFLRSEEVTEEQNNLLSDFENVLNSFLFNLNDLHDAIKHIALITEFKNQNWLEDLKAIYLNKANKKNLAKIILHLSLSKLLDSIEDSSSRGVEENFRTYLKKNRETVEKSKEECLFVLNVLEELRRLNKSVS